MVYFKLAASKKGSAKTPLRKFNTEKRRKNLKTNDKITSRIAIVISLVGLCALLFVGAHCNKTSAAEPVKNITRYDALIGRPFKVDMIIPSGSTGNDDRGLAYIIANSAVGEGFLVKIEESLVRQVESVVLKKEKDGSVLAHFYNDSNKELGTPYNLLGANQKIHQPVGVSIPAKLIYPK